MARAERVVILVPRRNDNGHRDRLWAWCKARWETYFPEFPIYEGHHTEGPFNRAAGINAAAKAAGDWDVAIVIDSDVFLPVSQVLAGVQSAREGKVTWCHRRWYEFSKEATFDTLARLLDFGLELEVAEPLVEARNPLSWSCCIAIPRAVWDSMGGFDERFRGWGFEDMAFQSLVRGLYPWARIEGAVFNLWHPRSPERIVKGQSRTTASPEYLLNGMLGRRYMVALIRDYGAGDQPGEEKMSAELSMRHIMNLTEDDRLFRLAASRKGMPEASRWADWWPTLEELRDGAKAGRLGPAPTVSLVVHTGGDPVNWPTRRAYLQLSLASLMEKVQGPIVQRVLYDVWGNHQIRKELTDIGEPYGFYVAGPEPEDWRPGHSWSRGMFWRYVGRRAIGDYVFGAEDDFLYSKPVDLMPMIETLERHPEIIQIALLRAPYYPRELAAGSIMDSLPRATFTLMAEQGTEGWVEHRDHFTNNPSLYRQRLAAHTVVPAGADSEARFSRSLIRDPNQRFAYWGDGTPWIRHIGEERAGTGY